MSQPYNRHKHDGGKLLIQGHFFMGVPLQKFCYYLDITTQSYLDKTEQKDSKQKRTSVSTELLQKLRTLVKTFYPHTPAEKKRKQGMLRKLDDEINNRTR